jgi:phospholipid-binding lipoprotein MlaA
MQPIVRLLLIPAVAVLLAACSKSTTTQTPSPIHQPESAAISRTDELADSDDDAFDLDEDDGFDDFDDFGDFEDEFSDDPITWDPLEGYNRFMTGVNDKLYVYVLDPVARGYRWVVPAGPRKGVDRFFTNLLYPIRAVNNVLQFKLKNAGVETLRFVTNSTIGILGFWDPAKDWFGLEAYPEDFGQTLGFYGIGPGPHIVLPVLGPSNLRDLLSMVPDYVYLDPKSYWLNTDQQLMVKAFDTVNYTSLHIGEYDSVKKDAVDFYPFLRDVYEQNRKKKIEE